MRADNSHHIVAAARRRATATRRRAAAALRRMDNTGQPISFDAVAWEAKVSRSWLYNQPDLRAEIERLRSRRNPAPAVRPVPDRQRASDASLRRRLEVATQRNSELEAENRQLRAALAIALGDQRAAARHRHHPRHAETRISNHYRAMLTAASSTLTSTHPRRSATRALAALKIMAIRSRGAIPAAAGSGHGVGG